MNRILGAILFVTIFSAIFYGLQYYVFARIRRLFYFKHKFRYYFYVLGLTFAFPLIMVISEIFWNWFVRIIYIIFMVYLGALFILFIILLIHQIILLFVKIPKRIAQFSISIIFIGLLLFSLFNASFITVKEVEIPADVNDTITIAQITDLHLGPIYSKDHLENVVAKINDLNPDLVVITGDFVEGSEDISQDMIDVLNQLNSPSVFVMGNHETFGDLEKILSMIRQTNTTVLVNETTSYKDIEIIGIQDVMRTNKKEIDSILSDINYQDNFTILLSHEPLDFESIEKYPIDLQISGHTHNGQIVPFNWIIKYELPLIDGLYQQGTQYTYVSPGTGTWGPPMRLGSNNQITLFHLSKLK